MSTTINIHNGVSLRLAKHSPQNANAVRLVVETFSEFRHASRDWPETFELTIFDLPAEVTDALVAAMHAAGLSDVEPPEAEPDDEPYDADMEAQREAIGRAEECYRADMIDAGRGHLLK